MSKEVLQGNNSVDLIHSLVRKKDHLYKDTVFCSFFFFFSFPPSVHLVSSVLDRQDESVR